MFKVRSSKGKTLVFKIGLVFLVGALLFLLLILPLRGVMNAISRIDFISQRLDDYPHMYAIYRQETEEWWNWWMKEDFGKRAQQAAFIYENNGSFTNEEDTLSFITKTLNVQTAEVLAPSELQTHEKRLTEKGLNTCYAELSSGKLILLGFIGNLQEEHMGTVESENNFLSQLQAGLPGYVCILHNDELSMYPKDENEASIRTMIHGMLEKGKLNPEADTKAAKSAAINGIPNTKNGMVLTSKYLLYSAAYSDSDDYVIAVTDLSTLLRFGRKRSWSLWFLCCAAMVLLGSCLWKTRLYQPDITPAEAYRKASKKGISAMFMAGLLLLCSVLIIQMLSGVNLSQQGATDQAEYLENVLYRESERAKIIEDEFDSMYTFRAQKAAAILSNNPHLIDADSLYKMDRALGGSALRVYDAEGKLIASDELLQKATDDSLISTSFLISNKDIKEKNDADSSSEADDESQNRYYRAIISDSKGKTNGWVELSIEQAQLNELLKDTTMLEVVGDLHILDTLHVVVVESGTDGKIVAGTWKNWIGESAEKHGIHTELLYDEYEGIVSFDGNKCYSVVFGYDNDLVIVGSEDETTLVFIGGVLVLTCLLLLVMFIVYRVLIRLICDCQKAELEIAAYDPTDPSKQEFPPLWEYLRDFMIAVFLLTSVLFIATKGDPAGLTYNIVRGKWIRGVNIATITTSIMLVSMVFAVQRLIDVILLKLGKYLSPKGMTICRLIDSFITYVGAIVMLLYVLSMFGVNAATLVGGVGAIALIFTLGANSLIADVLAGMFIIFEGDYTVGDVVIINDFRGKVVDISMRTTKLMDDDTHDIKIISNSSIKELINQSREKSYVIIDIPINRSYGVEKGSQIVQEAIKTIPDKFPQIIGEPEFWGISDLPKKHQFTDRLGGFKTRIAFNCLECDREKLTFQIHSELVDLIAQLDTPLASAVTTESPAENTPPASV